MQAGYQHIIEKKLNNFKIIMRKYKEIKPLIKKRAKIVKILNIGSWISQNFIEYTILSNTESSNNIRLTAKNKLYQHKQISSDIESVNMLRYTFQEVQNLYKKYVEDCEFLKMIDSEYELISKGYECTTNSWHDVDALGVTIHPESLGISSTVFNAKTPAEARYKFKIDNKSDFVDIKVRRYLSNDLYLLKNPKIYFPILNKIDYVDIGTMLHATGNKLGLPPKNIRNNFHGQNNVSCQFLNSIGLMKLNIDQGEKIYSVTELGLKIIAAILPTYNKKYHYSGLIESIKQPNNLNN